LTATLTGARTAARRTAALRAATAAESEESLIETAAIAVVAAVLWRGAVAIALIVITTIVWLVKRRRWRAVRRNAIQVRYIGHRNHRVTQPGRRLHANRRCRHDRNACATQKLLFERIGAASHAQQDARDEPIHERHLQLIAVGDLHLEQIRILDVDAALRAGGSAPGMQSVVRNLALTFDLNAEVIERLACRIQDANARVCLQLGVDLRD